MAQPGPPPNIIHYDPLPEDPELAVLRQQAARLERTLNEIRDLFTVDQWWRGNRARFVVLLIDSALAREEAITRG